MDDIKKDIRKFLAGTDEANVKQIARAIRRSETEVINALNAMRVYAEVECRQGGRGKGMTYWLTKAGADPKPAAKPEPVTGQQPEFGAVPEATKAMREKNVALQHELIDVRALLSLARQKLGIDEGTSIVQAIEKLQKCRDGHVAAVIEWETLMMKLVGEDGIGDVKAAIEKMKAELSHARTQIAALNEQLMNGEEAVDLKDATKGYLVCAPKRKPAKVTNAESAVARAKSAAKSAGRSEVFALVPVGVATRKQVLAVEFKEKAA